MQQSPPRPFMPNMGPARPNVISHMNPSRALALPNQFARPPITFSMGMYPMHSGETLTTTCMHMKFSHLLWTGPILKCLTILLYRGYGGFVSGWRAFSSASLGTSIS
jgi:hypothetical protein